METFFAENLKYLRKEKGWKREEMKHHSGFSPSTWGNYEAGYSTPNFQDLIRICQIFGVSETNIIHSDLSKGKLTSISEDTEKGKGKGKGIGKVIPEIEHITPIKKATDTGAGSLSRLAVLQAQQVDIQNAINAEIIGLLEGYGRK